MGRFHGLTSTSVQPNVPISPSTEATLPINQITDRPGGDTRPLNQSHVEALAESIAAVGLVQPIAVDRKGQLLAGGHRKAAIALLQEQNPEAFAQHFSNGVPIRRFDFDASHDEALALAIEATENEKRRDYTAVEVRELADRLRQAGFEDLKGRPKKGQKSIVLALSTIIGKSDKTVRRYLLDDEGVKGRQMSTFSGEAKATARLLAKLVDRDDCPDDIAKQGARLLKLLVTDYLG